MIQRSRLVALVGALLWAGVASAQDTPILDMLAEKVIHKYQNSSCEQLAQQRQEPKPPMEQEAVQKLRQNPQLAEKFFSKIAAPIANKLFECGMIP